jgi:transcription elongation factor GreB
MNKAFVKEDDSEEVSPLPDMPTGVRNYVTPAGHQAMQQALRSLEQQSPATSRSRDVEQRIQYLRSRLETMEIVDASVHAGSERIYFGATVTYQDAAQDEHTVTLVGMDEADPAQGRISWLSPVAQALLGAYEGDSATVPDVGQPVELTITDVRYPQPVK